MNESGYCADAMLIKQIGQYDLLCEKNANKRVK